MHVATGERGQDPRGPHVLYRAPQQVTRVQLYTLREIVKRACYTILSPKINKYAYNQRRRSLGDRGTGSPPKFRVEGSIISMSLPHFSACFVPLWHKPLKAPGFTLGRQVSVSQPSDAITRTDSLWDTNIPLSFHFWVSVNFFFPWGLGPRVDSHFLVFGALKLNDLLSYPPISTFKISFKYEYNLLSYREHKVPQTNEQTRSFA